jgi:amino acid transporter
MRTHRDAGLIRAVGTGALTAALVNIVIGAGIFTIPSALAGAMGVYAPLAFVICGIAMGAIAICFAEGGSRIPSSGGAYGYIEAAFGPLAGFVTGNLLWLGGVLACGAVAAALADVTASLVPPSLTGATHAAVIVGVIGVNAYVSIAGVSQNARVISIATVVKLVPISLFVAIGIFAVHPSNLAPAAMPSPQDVGRGLILALFAFTGMEATLGASGEVMEPAKTIPRALLIAMVVVAVLYVSIQTVAQGILGGALGQATTPLAAAMATVHPGLRMMMLAGAGISMLAWMSSDFLGNPRILFAVARDGFLPQALGRVHPRTHTPYVAITCYAAMSIALALSGTFAELAVLSTLATSVVYVLGSMAAWRLARQGIARAGPPLNFRWLGTAAIVATFSMIVLTALASQTEIVGIAALVAAIVTAYGLQVWRRAPQPDYEQV